MTWRHPEWYALVLISLAAFRTYRIVAADTITARWRAWLTGYQDDGHRVTTMTPPWRRDGHGKPSARQPHVTLRTFLGCRWCAGWWISVVWWGFWLWEPTATLWATIPFAVSAIAALVSKNLDQEE